MKYGVYLKTGPRIDIECDGVQATTENGVMSVQLISDRNHPGEMKIGCRTVVAAFYDIIGFAIIPEDERR